MISEVLFKVREKAMYHDIIESLVTALEAKDIYTKGHSERVAFMTYELSKKLGLKGIDIENIHIAAHLHDIGKIGIPDKILNKQDKLLPSEWEVVKIHPKTGYDILNKSKKLRHIAKIVLYHHERWDGKGYPNGLRRIDIPLGSRIIAVCDAIDAMISNRPYRKPMSFQMCIKEILINKAIMFDPCIVDYIEDNLDFMMQVMKLNKINNNIFKI